MTTELVVASGFDVIKLEDASGEYWSARDLMPLLGYEKWERFEDAIERAVSAINNTGSEAPDHIRGAGKMVQLGSGSFRQIIDYRLTRFGAYMVAMNSDPRKEAVARAQTYFAVKTREAEVGPRQMSRLELIDMARESEIEAIAQRAARELAESKVAELEPSAKAWEHLASSDGDLSVNQVATTLSRDPEITIGEGRLWKLLDSWGWTYRASDGARRPYQAQVDSGRLASKAMSHHHPRTGELVLDPPQVRVSVKGIAEIRRRLTSGQTLAAV